MSSDIDEISSYRKFIDKLRPISHAETDAVIYADIQNILHYPAFISELQCMPDRIFAEKSQKPRQPLPLDIKPWRELPEHDLQFFFQSQCSLEKTIEWSFRIYEPLDVGDESAADK